MDSISPIFGSIRALCPETDVYIAYIEHTIGTVSARLPEELEGNLEAYIDEEHPDRSSAVRTLLTEGLGEWRTRRALEQLRAGEVTFTRAAELADLTVWDFAQLVRDRDITWVSEDGAEADLEAL